MSGKSQIALISNLFKSRTDVFAIRWEKDSKSGYFPAYIFDSYNYRLHKIKGGSFNDYTDKEFLPLTEEQILKHLNGEQFIGIYPLLKDNTSWFIAADFDKEKWLEESLLFMKECETHRIPAYLERSRSGKGGHVWIFFEKPYPAFRSRKTIISLLEKTGTFSRFDKLSSFDRLFPNQDTLSGKGFGNLIALPFNKMSTAQGNCCFVNPVTLKPYPDQIEFMQHIRKISLDELDKLYSEALKTMNDQASNESVSFGVMIIRLNEKVRINRSFLPIPLVNFLKEELNIANTEFFVKKKLGKNTWKTESYFKLIEETEQDILIPRGFTGKIIRFCREHNIDYEFKDERIRLPSVKFSDCITLLDHQIAAVEAVSKKDFGVIVAPPGTGKTIIGLKIIAEKQQPALILVHRKQLADQWIERIQTFLGIPKHLIGRIGQGKSKTGKAITVGMIQSLSKELKKNDSPELIKSFGTIIVDECHHVPAETYKTVISRLHSFYMYGLTATPFRKYNDGKLIFVQIGDIIYEVKPQEISGHKKATIIIRNTELDIPFNSKTDKFETLSKVLIHDTARNKIILEDVNSELALGYKSRTN